MVDFEVSTLVDGPDVVAQPLPRTSMVLVPAGRFPRQLMYTQIALLIAVVAGLFVAGAYVSERKTADQWAAIAEQSQVNLAKSRGSEEAAVSDLADAQSELSDLADADTTIRELEQKLRVLQEDASVKRSEIQTIAGVLSICFDYQADLKALTGASSTNDPVMREGLLAKLDVSCGEALRLVTSLTS
jgi:hypothetical protein